MESEIIETGKALSPIIVASIGALAGLVSGAFASLVAPWVHHAIESRRKSIEYKSNLIKETRTLLDKSEGFKDILTSSLWGFISDNLNEKEKKTIFPNTLVAYVSSDPINNMNHNDYRKQAISNMLSRLEKKWNLTQT